ncbi:DEP domain-containing protein 4 isoform X2 [Hypomesus transpacificus]|uniref:DEP domain-containing protein 4 isoform X2 n=1 Tax=Hypomesus transpacificus TaxID=137520 RepID=UPI001F078419|nr:DEP domain-containing protein 4 isoform X2 [Hypomesus transpacificus]
MMAVDLTPRFRRLNSQSRILRENIQPASGYSRPFRATQLWQNIILALQSQVEVRRRRKHLRVHPNCFTGSDAVDAVLSHLMQNIVFGASEVSRLKAARLCQALMEARVFESVGTKLFRRDKEALFEDSSSSLYRFLDRSVLPGSFQKADGCGDGEKVKSERQDEKRKKGSRLAEMRTISNPLAVGSSDRRVERLFKTINLQPILPASLNTAPSAPFLSKAVEEVWKQQTLLQLLQVVELPMLDCILTSPARARPQARGSVSTRQDLVISNTCLDRQLPQSLNLPQLDAWLAAAADCLEHFPDQLIVAAGEHLQQQGGEGPAKKEGAQKRLLFDTIAKYYSGQERAPLLSNRYLEVHAGILGLLDCGKTAEGTRACQLCLRLLEPGARDELRRLLAFMAVATQPEAYRLHKQTENRALISRMFQKGIIQNKDLSRSQIETLVLFLMDNHTQLFKTPISLIEAVRRTLQTLQLGRDPDSIAMFTFCQQVSPQQYEDQRDAATLDSLKQLLQQVSLDARLSTKDRGRLVKDFQRHHPMVFLQHFSSTF